MIQVAPIHAPVSEPSCAPWYAVRTRSNCERIAAERLLARRLVAYLPTLLARSRRRDRRSLLSLPLFPGYFFARVRPSHPDRLEVLSAPGVMHIVGFGNGPVVVPEWQVESIRVALESRSEAEVLWKPVRGQRVRVVAGVLAGAQGVVVKEADGSRRLAISVDLLGRALAVAVSSEHVEPAE